MARRPADPNSPLERAARGVAVVGIAFPLLLILLTFPVNRVAFMNYAFLGASIIHFRLGPSRREIGAVAAVGLAFAGVYHLLGGAFSPLSATTIIEAGAFLGVGSLVVNGALMLFATGDAQKSRLRAFLPGAAPIAFSAYSPVFFHFLNERQTASFDLHLYAFEERLGGQASFLIGRLFDHAGLLREISTLVYLALPLGMAVIFAAQMRTLYRLPVHLLKAYIVAGIIGVLMFNLLPAAGPVYVFPNDFPDHPPAISSGMVHTLALTDVRLNAMPSLHTVWVLLMLWNSRKAHWAVRAGAVLWVVLTLLATLGLGEHYLIDLVAAVPLAAAMQALSTQVLGWRNAARWQAIGGGLGITLAWTLLLRFRVLADAPAVLCWLLIAATVTIGVLLEDRVSRRAFAADPAPREVEPARGYFFKLVSNN